MPWTNLAFAVAVSAATAMASYVFLYARPAVRIACGVAAGVIIGLSPLIVPSEYRSMRFWAALVAVVLIVKLVTFVVSALVHEYLFDISVGRVQGYQTAFFAVQGVAVAATVRLRPRGSLAIFGMLATILFNLATSALFFMSVDQIVPFYQQKMPGGL